MSELNKKYIPNLFQIDTVPAHLYRATKSVLKYRERELLELKGPCSSNDCVLHYAHYGPCDIKVNEDDRSTDD